MKYVGYILVALGIVCSTVGMFGIVERDTSAVFIGIMFVMIGSALCNE